MTKAKKEQSAEELLPEALLIDDVQKFLGVEFNGDKAKFIKDVTKESHRIAKERSNHDPRRLAAVDEKIAKLRTLWEEEISEDKPTDEQKALEQELKDKGYDNVHISFPDAESYLLSANGKEDSGSMTVGNPAIVGLAEKLVNPEGY